MNQLRTNVNQLVKFGIRWIQTPSQQKTDPYQSETLVDGLCKQYELESFLNAYRFLDDASFAKAVAILWQ